MSMFLENMSTFLGKEIVFSNFRSLDFEAGEYTLTMCIFFGGLLTFGS